MTAATTTDLGQGFRDHGVATRISNHRGTVATVDGAGRHVALVWLLDHRGCYALLQVDAATGASTAYPTPFPLPNHDSPFSSLLSSRNRYYTHFDSHFVEFDPCRRAYTFVHPTTPRMAMGMTEDDAGRIWSVTYPNSGVVCYDPATGAFRDYGAVYAQNWMQYQRYVAADDQGWLYFAVGNTLSQLVMLDPVSGKATPVLAEAQRAKGTMAYVYRDLDGRVYGHPAEWNVEKDGWYELYQGQARLVGRPPNPRPKPIITSHQGLFHTAFPDGATLRRCDLTERVIAVEPPGGGAAVARPFDYPSDGAHIMGVAAAPDGRLVGGTAFPMRFAAYDPRADAWENRPCLGQWNTVATLGDRFFIGAYTHGYLLEWTPGRPWVPSEVGKAESNPRVLYECNPGINRPHALLAHPNGKLVVMGGTPEYGYTGGGLLFWDRERGAGTLLQHTDLLRDHSVASLLPLGADQLLVGSTTTPGTGGERKATVAELYVLDLATKAIAWRGVVLPGAQGYSDLCHGPGGLVYGIADATRFFVFDPQRRALVHEQDAQEFGGASYQQGARYLVPTPAGAVFVLFKDAIARVVPATHRLALVARAPVPVAAGGTWLAGRLYFASGSHLISYGPA